MPPLSQPACSWRRPRLRGGATCESSCLRRARCAATPQQRTRSPPCAICLPCAQCGPCAIGCVCGGTQRQPWHVPGRQRCVVVHSTESRGSGGARQDGRRQSSDEIHPRGRRDRGRARKRHIRARACTDSVPPFVAAPTMASPSSPSPSGSKMSPPSAAPPPPLPTPPLSSSLSSSPAPSSAARATPALAPLGAGVRPAGRLCGIRGDGKCAQLTRCRERGCEGRRRRPVDFEGAAGSGGASSSAAACLPVSSWPPQDAAWHLRSRHPIQHRPQVQTRGRVPRCHQRRCRVRR